MQLPALVLAAASVSSGVLASNMNNELEGRFHQRADALLKPRQSNLQTFTGALGGITAHPVSAKNLRGRGPSINAIRSI